MRRNTVVLAASLLLLSAIAFAVQAPRSVAIGDLSSIEGMRENPLIGYGIVVGLAGTGDRTQTFFTTQSLAGILQRMGVQVPAGSMRVNNVAAVMVTAKLPPFATHGGKMDVTVSSMGDARSLDGGLLLLTPLYGADGKVYAAAQGPLNIGGYSASSGANSKQANHPTVGTIPGGGTIERDLPVEIGASGRVCILLRDASFETAHEVVQTIDARFGAGTAKALDARRVEIKMQDPEQVPERLAEIQALTVPVHIRARIAVNERTGTIVMGSEVQLGAVSILHGNLSIEISKNFSVSQPPPFSAGTTQVTSQESVRAQEAPARLIELKEGATVAQLVEGLQKIGATARDVVAILQAMQAAGALQAELEVF